MKKINILLVTLATTLPISNNAFSHAGIMPQHSPMMFQVVENQFDFDNSTVKEAHIVQSQEAGYQGLEITLRDEAAKAFGEMTAAGVGKNASIVINNQIISTSNIQSSLGPKILITDIKKYDAARFINMLQVAQAKEAHNKPIVFQ